MVYSIKNTRNTEIDTVADNIMKVTNFGLRIPGKNYTSGYGESVAQNWLHIMENFACPNNGSDQPNPTNTNVNLTNPTTGQQWYDTSNNKMRVWNDTIWEISSGAATASVVPPVTPVVGDVWFNITSKQLFVYDGTDWLLVGPESAKTDSVFSRSIKINSTGAGGAGAGDGVAPTGGTTTDAFGIFVGNVLTGVWSENTIATPTYYYYDLNDGSGNVRYYSFNPYDSKIEKGVNIEAGSNKYFNGKTKLAETADAVAGIVSTELMRNDNGAGASTSRIPSVGSLDIGSAANKWGTVYATTFSGDAVFALYADIAERYKSDASATAGTLMKLGGIYEITQTTEFADINVFGVVSDEPAYGMNASAGSDSTHPFIALAGRLNVKITGSVKKGQRLVASSIQGTAIAVSDDFAKNNVLSVIGRALNDSNSNMVEVVVGVK